MGNEAIGAGLFFDDEAFVFCVGAFVFAIPAVDSVPKQRAQIR